MSETSATVDAAEIGRFAERARDWWVPDGSFRALHRLNPIRLGFIRHELIRHFGRDARRTRPFEELHLLDIGCGGGLVAEPMARLGFTVTAIDAGAEAIGVARAHAGTVGLAIDYRVGTAESLADAGVSFDAVLALEIVEHVADRALFFEAMGRLVRPGGAAIVATLNRTAKSFALAILGAEYLLRWLPPGTHDWRKFVRPSELVAGLRAQHVRATRIAGVRFDPLAREWSLSADIEVNYMVAAARQ